MPCPVTAETFSLTCVMSRVWCRSECPGSSVPGVGPSVPPSVRESVCQMFYSTQLCVFLAPGCFIRKEGGGRRPSCGSPERGHDCSVFPKPAGRPRANIKQPEHLFPESAPRSASAQMKGPESFRPGGNCTEIKDVTLFKWRNRMVFNWWMFWGLRVCVCVCDAKFNPK